MLPPFYSLLNFVSDTSDVQYTRNVVSVSYCMKPPKFEVKMSYRMKPSKFEVNKCAIFSITCTVCYIIPVITIKHCSILLSLDHNKTTLCHVQPTQTAFLSGGNCLLTPTHVNTYTNTYMEL